MTPGTMIAQATADTVVMIQARDGLTTASQVASLVLVGVFILILGALAALLLQLRGIQRTVAELTGRLEKRIDPILDRGKEVAANVEFISAAMRTDIQHVSDSVRSISDRLQTASDRMEERIAEFNALMEVVQSEAEDVFIGSSATLHGIRAGARAWSERRGQAEPSDAELERALEAQDAALSGGDLSSVDATSSTEPERV